MSTLTISYLLLVCALHHIDARGVGGNYTIHGGHPVSITEVPFMARFTELPYNQWCGAVIVHPQFLVSAAHCYRSDSIKHYEVKVGSDKLNSGEKYEIENVFPHPKFSLRTADYDVLVIKLKKKLQFSDRVRPIKMADRYLALKDGEMLDVVGFGQAENGKSSEQLLQVETPYVEQSKCNAIISQIPGSYRLTERMLCAGGEQGKSSCHGDSGGPLRYKNQLVGIVSWGHKCGQTTPTMYARVTALRDYIDGVIRNNQ